MLQFSEGPVQGTIDLSSGEEGEYFALHDNIPRPDEMLMRKRLRRHEPRARTPPSMRDFIPDNNEVKVTDMGLLRFVDYHSALESNANCNGEMAAIVTECERTIEKHNSQQHDINCMW